MRWFVSRNGETMGPAEDFELKAAAQKGLAGAMVRDEHASAWIPIEQSPFAAFLPPAPIVAPAAVPVQPFGGVRAAAASAPASPSLGRQATNAVVTVIRLVVGISGGLLIVVLFAKSCLEGSSTTTSPTALPAVPVIAPVRDPSTCRGCSNASTAFSTWIFDGVYLDAKCTQPVIHDAPNACQTVPALGPVTVSPLQPIWGHRPNSKNFTATASRQIGHDEAQHLFLRQDGSACAPYAVDDVKITPLWCDGKRVCRDANSALVCDNCRTVAGCPDYEGSMIYAAAEK